MLNSQMDYISDTQSGYDHKDVAMAERNWGPSARSSVDISDPLMQPPLQQHLQKPQQFDDRHHNEGGNIEEDQLAPQQKSNVIAKTEKEQAAADVELAAVIILQAESPHVDPITSIHPETTLAPELHLDEYKHHPGESVEAALKSGDQISLRDDSLATEREETTSLRRPASIKSNIAYCTEELEDPEGAPGATDSHPGVHAWTAEDATEKAPKKKKKGLVKIWKRFKENFHLGKSASNH